MKRLQKKNKYNMRDMQEKALNWIWVILFISAIMFLRDLLSDMHTETTRLSDERMKLQEELSREREKSKELYDDFYAELNESIKKALEAVGGRGISQ